MKPMRAMTTDAELIRQARSDPAAFGMLYRAPQRAWMDRPWGRPTRGGQAPASWQSGIYVFSVRDTAGAVSTFAIDLEIIPLRGPAAAGLTSPAP